MFIGLYILRIKLNIQIILFVIYEFLKPGKMRFFKRKLVPIFKMFRLQLLRLKCNLVALSMSTCRLTIISSIFALS